MVQPSLVDDKGREKLKNIIKLFGRENASKIFFEVSS